MRIASAAAAAWEAFAQAHFTAEQCRAVASLVDHRAQPPRTTALPSSFRDAGNRISFDGLRGFAETRDSDL